MNVAEKRKYPRVPIHNLISYVCLDENGKGSAGATLKPFHALWCAPGSPYKSMDGALQAIQFAREKKWPFLGT